MFEFAILGITWWILVLSSIVFGVLVAITSSEKPLSALVFFIVSWTAITFLSGTNPFNYVVDHAGDIFVWIGVYLLIGVAYAYAKWTWFYLPSPYVQTKITETFNAFKSHWSRTFSDTKTNDELIEEFVKSSHYPFGLNKDKWKISTWVIWWPINLFWNMLDDVMIKVWEWFSSALSGSFASIAKSQVKKTIDKTSN
jgi:hypothetical protein